MAIKRKRHLKYHAKKGRTSISLVETGTIVAADPSSQLEPARVKQANAVKNTRNTSYEGNVISRLPVQEVTFVRRELIYLFFVALVVLALYVVIWLVFRYTNIDDRLYSLIKLKS